MILTIVSAMRGMLRHLDIPDDLLIVQKHGTRH